MSCHVLTNYPLSTQYKSWLERELGCVPRYLTIPELRGRPMPQIIAHLRSLRGDLFLPLEDENSSSILPVLQMLAAMSGASRIEVILPGGGRSRFPRIRTAGSALSFVLASARCIISLRSCARELRHLNRSQTLAPFKSDSKRVLYLNSNLWFGVKAGGSVGHISGVVNGFVKLGYDVNFVSAGSRLMTRPEAEYIQLAPPNGYGVPYDGNYYAFHRSAVSRLDQLLSSRPAALIYQRMSVANYTGVILSRKHRLPLVLEYNGSEVWIAEKWGRRLSNPDIAERAEQVCLRHAHAIVTVSGALRSELLGRGVPAERIVTYPNCIDEALFNPSRFSETDIRELRCRYGIAGDAIIVSFLGTFGQWHGIEVMGEAIRLMATGARQFLEDTKTHFLIVGDGPRMAKLREILSDSRCAGFYSLPGLIRQEEAPLHLAGVDIVLSPHVPNVDGTAFFGSPTKLFEYMGMGKAIIASDLDQIGEVLKNSVHSSDLPDTPPADNESRLSVLCRPADPGDLARALEFLIRSPRWRQVLGKNAREEALTRYTWRQHVEAVNAKLHDLRLV
jgi:glycosyltransferase involved in cell wall biosynthesis